MSLIRCTPLWSVVIAATLIAVPAGPAFAIQDVRTDHSDVGVRSVSTSRAHIADVANRKEVQTQLENLGISADEAQRRIAALSDAEVMQIDGQLATLPAGGDSTITIGVGAAIIIALLLIILL